MLLGHWYLIETGLTLTPLWRVLRFFVATLRAQLAMLALAVAASLTSPRGATAAAWDDHLVLFSSRVLFGPVAAYALAEMIRRTLAIPQTMAATGLFYIALLAVLVGEILGRSLLFRTGWPV
jgi:predicted membrane protein